MASLIEYLRRIEYTWRYGWVDPCLHNKASEAYISLLTCRIRAPDNFLLQRVFTPWFWNQRVFLFQEKYKGVSCNFFYGHLPCLLWKYQTNVTTRLIEFVLVLFFVNFETFFSCKISNSVCWHNQYCARLINGISMPYTCNCISGSDCSFTKRSVCEDGKIRRPCHGRIDTSLLKAISTVHAT